MKSNYFNSPEIKPTVRASAQHAAFVNGDIVFDWTSFEIPRGTAKLLGATISMRSKGDADATVQPAGVDLLFAKGPVPDTSPPSLGTANGVITTFSRTDIIGVVPSATSDIVGTRTAYQSTISSCELVLVPEPSSGSNVGVDKYYIAGLAGGAIDFQSGIITDGTNATNQPDMTYNGVDARIHFAVGDVINDQDDVAYGTIKTITVNDDANFSMTAELLNTQVNDKSLYNIHPIRITLHFSK